MEKMELERWKAKMHAYAKAENKAYANVENKGYVPGLYNIRSKKVVVFKIENRNTNNEKREIYYFKNWQDADKNLN